MDASNKKMIKKLITHNGSFHADDIFAAAAFSLMLEKRGDNFKIIRTRDPEIIKNGDYVFDVGGIYEPKKNRFDHHQISFKEKRKSGILYSSIGLVWKKYGIEICGRKEIRDYLEKVIIEQIDANDNGISIFTPLTTHTTNYDISLIIASFRPAWGEKDSLKFFKNAVKFAKQVIKKEIKQYNALLKIKKLINQAHKKSKNKKLLILDTEIPRYLISIAIKKYKNIYFIIFKDNKEWKVLTVHKKDGIFENKKNLPSAWAGQRDEKLQKITGIKDAIFCHRGRFMAVAKTKEGAIKLAELALLA